MKEIIECVPNFSEGRNPEVINKIANAISNTEDCKLLNCEPDKDYNRLVVTFVGSKSGVLKGAINGSNVAASLIDMRNHKGEHPRLGAIDVVPFIPIKNVSMEECIAISNLYGEYISANLGIPAFLYESAAKKEDRVNLATIRKGEYEGLREKLQDPNWLPDYGSSVFNPKLGSTVTGARFFLIAYNINLKTENLETANELAFSIREIGKVVKDAYGNTVKKDGKPLRIPGKFKAVKAMGVALDKHKMTQVSINLINYRITNMQHVFNEVKNEAAKLNVETYGSEIVGLVPLEAIIEAGRSFNPDLSDNSELILSAVSNLGLDFITPFEPEKKIIEYLI